MKPKDIFQVLTIEELCLFYGYPMPKNEQFLNILKKIHDNNLGIYDEINTMLAYRMLVHDREDKEDTLKYMLAVKHTEALRKEMGI